MTIFIHGSDTYSSRQYLEQLITEGEVRVFNEESGWDNIITALASDGLWSSPALVVLKNILGQTEIRDNLAAYLESNKIPENKTLIVYQSGPVDKRLGLVKLLLREEAREFPEPTPAQVERFITTRVAANNKKIEPAAVRLLAQIVGLDLWRARSEVEKLSALLSAVITVADVNNNVRHGVDDDIWRFVDTLSAGNKKQALALLEQQFLSGAEPLYLLTMLIRQVRLLLALAHAQGSDAELAANLSLHPFVVQKTRQQARNFTVTRLAGIYQALVKLDAALKSGRGEPRLLFTVLLDSIMKNA